MGKCLLAVKAEIKLKKWLRHECRVIKKGTMMEKRLGFIGVVISDRSKSAPRVNSVLSEYGDVIVGRMGLPNADESAAVITLIVKMSTDEMGRLTGKLGMLDGVSVRSSVCKK